MVTATHKDSFDKLVREEGAKILVGPYGPDAKKDVRIAVLARNPIKGHSEQEDVSNELLTSKKVYRLIPEVLKHATAVYNQGFIVDGIRIRYDMDGFLKKYGINVPPDFWKNHIDRLIVIVSFPTDLKSSRMATSLGVDGMVITYYFKHRKLGGEPATRE